MALNRKWLAGLLTLLWVLATLHCGLEKVPGLTWLSCEVNPEQADCGDCGEAGDCCAAEAGDYKHEEHRAKVPVFHPVLISEVWPSPIIPFLAVSSVQFLHSDSPPLLPRSWQFIWRTAPEPRSPSLG